MSDSSENFRDTLATADKHGRRIWVYPTRPKGRLHTARKWVSWLLLSFLFGAPFITINGEPFLLLNIIERRFVIIGTTFWPQDFHLFVLFAIASVIIVFLFTAVYGRLFCGWVCPQTIFMEMVFRKIEYFIEGSAARQKQLNKQKMNPVKFVKKTSKHLIFYAISFLIGNTFLAYIIGVDQLFDIITDPPAEHVTGFIFMVAFSLIFYFIFAWFREQVCTMVCPYGRLQSVLLDKNTIVVAYEYKRGEPRTPMGRDQSRENLGDCVDCDACVKVCPTGIDIRNGTQLECINCTACIDACNYVMRKVNLPEGLIKYSSLNNIEHNRKFQLNPRIILYSAALIFITILTASLTFTRSNIETSVLRIPGSLFQETSEGAIQNLYNFKAINKVNEELGLSIKLAAPEGNIKIVGDSLIVNKNSALETVLFVEIDKNKLFSPSTLIKLEIYSNGKLLDEINTTFMGPNQTGRNQP